MDPTLSLWSPPPARLALASDQLHLWRFRLDLPAAAVNELSPLLSSDEQNRAARLLDRSKAEQFIVARARMRQILGRYLKRKPEELTFAYGEQGKPHLVEPSAQELIFNLSHTGSWGVLAITAGKEVGVDIEQIDRQLKPEQVAAGFFSAQELEQLQKYRPARRRRGFYRIWTRKEACLKGEGSGFSAPKNSPDKAKWQTRSFVVAQDYLGTVACPEEVTVIDRWTFI